jgi:hypothetical protein
VFLACPSKVSQDFGDHPEGKFLVTKFYFYFREFWYEFGRRLL